MKHVFVGKCCLVFVHIEFHSVIIVGNNITNVCGFIQDIWKNNTLCIDLRSLTAEYEVLVWWVAIREEIIFIKHLLNNNNDLDNGAKTLFNSNNIDSKGFFSSIFISVG